MCLFMPHLYPVARNHVFVHQLEHLHIIINDTSLPNAYALITSEGSSHL